MKHFKGVDSMHFIDIMVKEGSLNVNEKDLTLLEIVRLIVSSE